MDSCPRCRQRLSVYVGDPEGLDWFSARYCESCGQRVELRGNQTCSACNGSLADFLSTGFLGCQVCYSAHEQDVRDLLGRYRGPGDPVSLRARPMVDSLARARSEEIRAALADVAGGLRGWPAEAEGLGVDDLGAGAHVAADRPESQKQGQEVPRAVSGVVPKIEASRMHKPHSALFGSGLLRSVRLRVARNLSGLPYLDRLSHTQRELLNRMLLGNGSLLAQPGLPGRERSQQLEQQKRAARFPARFTAARLFSTDSLLCSGDEDHLRYIAFLPASDRGELLTGLEQELAFVHWLDGVYEWQYLDGWGYLTACPANSGLGLRISFELNLPRLRTSVDWPDFAASLREAGLELRGQQGEGSTLGQRVQISNRFMAADAAPLTEVQAMLVILERAAARELQLRFGS